MRGRAAAMATASCFMTKPYTKGSGTRFREMSVIWGPATGFDHA